MAVCFVNVCFVNVFVFNGKIEFAVERGIDKQRDRQGPGRSSYAELGDF